MAFTLFYVCLLVIALDMCWCFYLDSQGNMKESKDGNLFRFNKHTELEEKNAIFDFFGPFLKHKSLEKAVTNNKNTVVTGQKSDRPDEEKRIVYGTPMEYNQWPWLVSLHFLQPIEFTKNTGMEHVCGGTIIGTDPIWVLTAAHCVSDKVYEGLSNPKNWRVVIGEYNQFIEDHLETIADIEEIFRHPNFTKAPLSSDIALLKLKPVDAPILQDAADLDSGEFLEGQECSVAGWGQITFVPYGYGMFIPLITTVSLVNADSCNASYSLVDERDLYHIDLSTVCAGSVDGHDACAGDSGGPLMCQSNNDNRWKLVGVVSAGKECGLKEFPGIYTSVSYYRKWIENITKSGLKNLEKQCF